MCGSILHCTRDVWQTQKSLGNWCATALAWALRSFSASATQHSVLHPCAYPCGLSHWLKTLGSQCFMEPAVPGFDISMLRGKQERRMKRMPCCCYPKITERQLQGMTIDDWKSDKPRPIHNNVLSNGGETRSSVWIRIHRGEIGRCPKLLGQLHSSLMPSQILQWAGGERISEVTIKRERGSASMRNGCGKGQSERIMNSLFKTGGMSSKCVMDVP